MNKRSTALFTLFALFATSLVCSCNGNKTPSEEPEIKRTTFYLNSQNEELFIGETFKLEPDGYKSKAGLTWISSSPTVASVTSDGLVSALAIGDAVISAYDDYSIAKCSISVVKHDENFYVTLSQDEIVLNVDDSFVVVPTFQNNEGPIDATFSVTAFSDGATDIATYDFKEDKHVFTAVSSGECIYSFTTSYNDHLYGANLLIKVN